MAESKSELKVDGNAPYTDNIAPEYMNHSSVARKPFEASDKDESKSEDNGAPKTPETPKAPAAPGDNK